MNEDNDVKLKTITIREKQFDIYVTENGRFYTQLEPKAGYSDDSNTIEATSILDLSKKIESTLKLKQKLNIRFVRWETGDYRESKDKLKRGTVIGVHGGNQNLLVQWDGEKSSEQDRSWGNEMYLRLDAIEEKEYVLLKKNLKALEARIEKFEQKHAIDMKSEVAKIQKES